MENELNRILDQQHVDIFCNVMGINAKDIQDIYVNPGRSANNENFVIVANKRSYLYRVPGKGTDVFCSRSREKLAYEILSPLSITDEVFYLSEKNGIKISKYYERSRIPRTNDRVELLSTMKALRKLHNCGIDFPYKDTLFDRMERYRTFVCEVGGDKYYLEGFDDYLNDMRIFRNRADSISQTICFTHGDASINNILITEEYDYPILIDMEFPAMGHPFEDIATFCVDAGLIGNDILEMLEFYLGRKGSSEENYHVLGLSAVAAMMWYSWAAYKSAVENDKHTFLDFRDDYHQYVGEVFGHAQRVLESIAK